MCPTRTAVVKASDSGKTPMSQTSPELALSGLELLREILDGSRPIPAFCATLDMRPATIAAGEVEFVAAPTAAHGNFVGSLHGGYLTGLLDTVMGCACHSLLGVEETYVTIELKTNFLKGVPLTGKALRAIGKVVQKGRSIAFVEGRVVDSAGNVVATATCTCMIRAVVQR